MLFKYKKRESIPLCCTVGVGLDVLNLNSTINHLIGIQKMILSEDGLSA